MGGCGWCGTLLRVKAGVILGGCGWCGTLLGVKTGEWVSLAWYHVLTHVCMNISQYFFKYKLNSCWCQGTQQGLPGTIEKCSSTCCNVVTQIHQNCWGLLYVFTTIFRSTKDMKRYMYLKNDYTHALEFLLIFPYTIFSRTYAPPSIISPSPCFGLTWISNLV